MNLRLNTLYEELQVKNRDNFLNNCITVDPMWGKPIKGVTLQIDLSEETRDAISTLQDELTILEPEALLLTPQPFQHISFNQVVYWGGDYKLGYDQTWAGIEEDFVTGFRKLDNKFPSFSISFIKLIPMTSAIIWSAIDQHNEMQVLRETCQTRLPFPKETTKKNTFIHTTLARYKEKLCNPHQIDHLLKKYQTPVDMEVKEIILRKENIYPSLNTTDLARIRLQ